MKLWIILGEQCLAQARSLLALLGLIDRNGELAWNATFLCCEAPQCIEPSCNTQVNHN